MQPPELQVTDEKNFLDKVCLRIGNLEQDTTEEEIRILLGKYGEVMKCELYLERACAIVEMDVANVKKANRELHGMWYKGRQLEMYNIYITRVEKLSWIHKELFEKVFDMPINKISSIVIFIDDKNESIGEGITEFQAKLDAQLALQRSQKCYILMANAQTINVETVEQNNTNDLSKKKNIPCKIPKFCTSRKNRLQFTRLHIQCKYSKQWKNLHEEYKRAKEELEQELMIIKEELEAQLECELEKIFLSKRIISEKTCDRAPQANDNEGATK